MNSPPPSPSPSGVTCPNCGTPRDAGLVYCANCGAPVQGTNSASAGASSKIMLSILLALGAVAFGSLGACLGLVGVMGGNFSTDWGYSATGVVALVAAVACLLGIRRLNSKK